jgi:AcrR family transcriptional regulator
VGRPKEHGEETAEALLVAAERVLEREGLDAVSIRRLADEVGTTTRAVYSLFGSKEGLLVALAARGFDILRANVDAQRLTSSPQADLAKAGFAFRAFSTEHPALFRLAVQRELPDPRLALEYRASATAAFARLEARVQRFADHAGLRLDVHDAATQYHALCEGLAAVELRPGLMDPRHAERVWRDGLTALVDGFAATKPR